MLPLYNSLFPMAGKFFDNPYHVIYNYLVQFIDSHRVVPRNVLNNISWYYFLLYINFNEIVIILEIFL